jgi:enamine deaminase RidA (YjgF/YER057c/UK114 family)
MSEAAMTRTAVVPASMKRMYERLHFSPGLRAGGLLFVSGQVGVLQDSSVASGVAAQIDAALANLRLVLDLGGARLDGVVELTSFHVGDMAEHFAAIVPAIERTFPEPWPAWTAVQVVGLARPDLLVEIKAVALV